MGSIVGDSGLDVDLRFDLYDYNRFKKLLKQIDPDMRKMMDREIRAFAKPVTANAKGFVPESPMRNWARPGGWVQKRISSKTGAPYDHDLSFSKSEVVRGIAIRQGGKRNHGSAYTTVWWIQNKSAAGSVYEIAGRKQKSETPQARAFVANLNREGKASRLIWRAVDGVGGQRKLNRDIAEVIHRYESELQARLNA